MRASAQGFKNFKVGDSLSWQCDELYGPESKKDPGFPLKNVKLRVVERYQVVVGK